MSSPTILVTGASRGVGREVARFLVSRGADVVGVHRRESRVAAELGEELGPRFWPVRADLTRDEGIAEVTDFAERRAPRGLAAAVFSAAVVVRAPFADRESAPDPLRAQLRADLEAPLLLCRSLLRARLLGEGASILFISSNIARRSVEGCVAYGAAKGGLEAATRGLARELGPQGIRVNAIAPGLLRTDMTRQMDETQWAAYAAEVPLRRVGEAADVAPLAAFLVGPGSDYITGQVIDIDGGWGS